MTLTLEETPAARPCQHPRANHQHGTRVRYKMDRCRCTPCRDAQKAYMRDRSRQAAYGRWQPYVDAEPARRHVRDLMDAGLGWKQVAERSGVGTGCLSKLLWGSPTRGAAPSRRIRPATADALLAVRPDRVAAGQNVDPTGTHRRLQALVAAGWSQAQLANRLGMLRSNFGRMIGSRTVLASTRDAVAALYERIAYAAPPAGNHHERQAASRARNYAAARGWPPPAAWFAVDIDDPAAVPDVEGVRTVTRRGRPVEDVVEDAADLARAGVLWEVACTRLGMSQDAVDNALRRGGRPDLIQALKHPGDVAIA